MTSVVRAWCEDQGFSEKVMALLSVWNPDIEELYEWDVEENTEENYIDVNGSRYRVFTPEDMEREIESYQADLQQDIEDGISAQFSFVTPFINWNDLWYSYSVQPDEVYPGIEEIIFEAQTYYYIEWSNL